MNAPKEALWYKRRHCFLRSSLINQKTRGPSCHTNQSSESAKALPIRLESSTTDHAYFPFGRSPLHFASHYHRTPSPTFTDTHEHSSYVWTFRISSTCSCFHLLPATPNCFTDSMTVGRSLASASVREGYALQSFTFLLF